MMMRLCPRRLGSLVQANARRLLLLLGLALLILCAAINSAKFDSELSSWIQRTSRVESELKAIETAIGDGAGSNSLLLLQTLKQPQQEPTSTTATRWNQMKRYINNDSEIRLTADDSNLDSPDKISEETIYSRDDILSIESLNTHLEALAIATHTTVDLFDVSWSLKDICLAPTPPDYEGLIVNQMLDHLMPCVIKTPLDCFWDGAKLLGPEQDVRLSSLGPKLKWTSLNPVFMMELQRRNHPHASFPYQTLLDWMRRVGINNGYLDRPCINPNDPACPATAPNKLSGVTPDIGHTLTGGCRGLASKQMHWKEEEIVGGVKKNKSGHIVSAEALQSTVLLMGERDVYDYWRKTNKVQDINNWSTDKAKMVLDSWQRRFKEELAQYARSTAQSNAFKIQALTPRSMLEPVDNNTILDLTNFKNAALLMTLFMCLAFPNFQNPDSSLVGQNYKQTETSISINRFKMIILALSISILVIITFVASLGLCSFINIPFNMATLQILPPLALFYGCRQALMMANIYSKHFRNTSQEDLTTECLMESMPIIVIECTTFIIPLIVATAFPVQATRIFTLHAITFVILSTLMVALFVPSLLTIFLTEKKLDGQEKSYEVSYRDKSKSRSRSISPGVISIISRKNSKPIEKPIRPSVDREIFSRLQDDLRNIKNDRATDFNFSARFGPDGFKTSFSLKTTPEQYQTSTSQQHMNSVISSPEPPCDLPDLLLKADRLAGNELIKSSQQDDFLNTNLTAVDMASEQSETGKEPVNQEPILDRLLSLVIDNKSLLMLVIAIKVLILVLIATQTPKVRFGLQLRELLLRDTEDYESFLIRERHFPVFNIFAITKGGMDYPSKQKLLHEFYEKVSNVDGILNDDLGIERKFWLIYFRDWLLELQEIFDQEKNRSVISKDGWTDDASDSAKLAYKLLVQTGKIDNPIDKNLIDTNRLVDKDGIINQRAFYYYLTAWVMNDAFSYSSSEADFRPEPKTWNANPNDLRIERARPLNYAQIPFVFKLSEDNDNMKSILEIRAISQRFDSLDLPNFPTGIPFIFWDQFINLDYLFYTAVCMISAVLYLLIGIAFSNFLVALILILPTVTTLFEIYCLLGYLSMPFNSIVGVMIITTMGILTAHKIQIITYFEFRNGYLVDLISHSLRRSLKTVISSLVLLLVTALVFNYSKIDFMTKYSRILLYISVISGYDSLILTPSLLALFSDDRVIEQSPIGSPSRSPLRSPKLIMRSISEKKMGKQSSKKLKYPRVQSEISLSTISEEPQSEAQAHDLKLNFSIRC